MAASLNTDVTLSMFYEFVKEQELNSKLKLKQIKLEDIEKWNLTYFLMNANSDYRYHGSFRYQDKNKQWIKYSAKANLLLQTAKFRGDKSIIFY